MAYYVGNDGLRRNERQAAVPTLARNVRNGTPQREDLLTAFGRPESLCAGRLSLLNLSADSALGFGGRREGVKESTPSGPLFHKRLLPSSSWARGRTHIPAEGDLPKFQLTRLRKEPLNTTAQRT